MWNRIWQQIENCPNIFADPLISIFFHSRQCLVWHFPPSQFPPTSLLRDRLSVWVLLFLKCWFLQIYFFGGIVSARIEYISMYLHWIQPIWWGFFFYWSLIVVIQSHLVNLQGLRRLDVSPYTFGKNRQVDGFKVYGTAAGLSFYIFSKWLLSFDLRVIMEDWDWFFPAWRIHD